MLYSMTGYGRAEQTINDKPFLIEMRALNSKQLDMRLLLPGLLKPFEIDIRGIIGEQLQRGSIECVITLKQNGAARSVAINTELLKAYYKPVMDAARELQLGTENVLSTLLKLPDVVTPATEVLSEEEWMLFKQMLLQAIDMLNTHRRDEGQSLEKDLMQRIDNIEMQQEAVIKLEPARRIKIKEGLQKLLEEHAGKDNYDPNRMEQELIYYIEKIDISEEQVRLKSHCDYFRSVMQENETGKGKKLSFILQEIGREINTTGSKAYDAEVQKCVVLMKDELEKAKEQILNIL